jgi:hypothetical protein
MEWPCQRRELRERIIILEDIAAGTNIVKTLLTATMKKEPESMWGSKI